MSKLMHIVLAASTNRLEAVDTFLEANGFPSGIATGAQFWRDSDDPETDAPIGRAFHVTAEVNQRWAALRDRVSQTSGVWLFAVPHDGHETGHEVFADLLESKGMQTNEGVTARDEKAARRRARDRADAEIAAFKADGDAQ
jgi:hypothetical protein